MTDQSAPAPQPISSIKGYEIATGLLIASFIIAIGLLVASFIYHYAYYLRLGVNFSDVPLSTADYLRTYFEWWPYIIALFLMNVLGKLFSKKPESENFKGKQERKSVETRVRPLSKWYDYGHPHFKYWILIALIPAIFFVYKDSLTPLPLILSVLVACLWNALYSLFFSYRTPVTDFTLHQRKALYYIPMGFLFMLTYGYCQASLDIRNIHDGKEDGFVILKGSTAPHKPLLRILKKGVITYGKNGEVIFHTWKEIDRIEYNKRFPLYKDLTDWFLSKIHFKEQGKT
jgi:hypothetical protein